MKKTKPRMPSIGMLTIPKKAVIKAINDHTPECWTYHEATNHNDFVICHHVAGIGDCKLGEEWLISTWEGLLSILAEEVETPEELVAIIQKAERDLEGTPDPTRAKEAHA